MVVRHYWAGGSNNVRPCLFRRSCAIWGSPEFPQSNGLAENAVKQSKNLLEKCRRDRSDPYLALLNIQNVPRDKILGSSAQRLISRRTKGDIPKSKKLLNPEIRNPKEVHDQLLHKRNQQKKYFDKSSKLLPNLNTGDIVRMQTKKEYDQKGIICQNYHLPRSYIVESDGRRYRRNRRHILKANESYYPRTEEDIDYSNLSDSNTDVPSQSNIVNGSSNFVPSMTFTRSGRRIRPNPRYFSSDFVK
ncbi:uncharacterized protein LOC144426076 [Styela clava]